MWWLPLEIDLGPLAPQHFEEVVAGVIAIVVLWFVFAKFVSPMFEKMYQDRASQIEGGLMRAQQAEADAAALRKQYQEQLEAANADAARVREEAKANAAAVVAQMREQTAQESARRLDAARAQIAAERAAAADQLRQEVGGLATTLAGRIVGESLADDAKARQTVDRFLDDLAAQPAHAGAAS